MIRMITNKDTDEQQFFVLTTIETVSLILKWKKTFKIALVNKLSMKLLQIQIFVLPFAIVA